MPNTKPKPKPYNHYLQVMVITNQHILLKYGAPATCKPPTSQLEQMLQLKVL